MRLLKSGIFILGVSYMAVVAMLYAGQRHMLYHPNDGGALAAAGGVPIIDSTRVTLKTRDGEKIAGWYVPPRDSKPVFLFLHGNGGHLERKKWRWKRIMKKGFGLFAISYRGFPGSTGSPSETGLIKDATAAYDWLRQKHSPKDIVIHGQSLGSGVAVMLAAQVNAKALILETPFTAIVDIAAEHYPWIPVHYLVKDQFLSREKVADINMPLLIVHGTKDSVVPFAHGKRLFQRASEPKTFVAIEGGDHNTLVRDGMYPHIWNFLDEK